MSGLVSLLEMAALMKRGLELCLSRLQFPCHFSPNSMTQIQSIPQRKYYKTDTANENTSFRGLACYITSSLHFYKYIFEHVWSVHFSGVVTFFIFHDTKVSLKWKRLSNFSFHLLVLKPHGWVFHFYERSSLLSLPAHRLFISTIWWFISHHLWAIIISCAF